MNHGVPGSSISEALLKISLSIQRMRRASEVEDVLKRSYNELRGLCDRIDTMAIHQVVEPGRFEVETCRIGPRGIISPRHLRRAELVTELWQSGRIYAISDFQKDLTPEDIERTQRKFGGLTIGSMLDVPFSSGVLSVHSQKTNAFTSDDVQMLKQVAEVFSVGYARVRDLETIEDRVRDLKRARRDLEDRVKERTADLEAANGELREQRERLDAQFSALPVPTHTWQRRGDDFVMVDYNEAAAEITEGTICDYIGRTLSDWLGDPDSPVARDLKRCCETQTTVRREVRRQVPQTGKVVDLDVTYVFVKPDIVIVHAVDLTDRKRLEAQLRHAQKMDAVGRLAGGVAHDFNNLLMVINGYSTQLLTDPRSIDERDALEGIRSAGERAALLTRRLLTFGRQQTMRIRAIDLSDVVRDMDRLLRRLVGERVELRTQLTPASDLVRADFGQMEQVLMNLVVNARDAMPGGGRIFVTTSVEEKGSPGDKLRFVRLAVADEGVGMDADLREHIFEPFFTTKSKKDGVGLGLSISYGIVGQSGGWMEVESDPGQGSTFSVCLPVTDEPSDNARREAAGAGGQPKCSGRILLVEDEALVRAYTSRILAARGYEVIEAGSAEDAFGKVGEEMHIDLLLTDVVMENLSGPDLAGRLKRVRPNLNVIYMSGHGEDVVKEYGIGEDGPPCLQKPFPRDLLLERIRQELQGEEDA